MTLGAHEVDDVAAAVAYLREAGTTTRIGLWGRSMGAVTAMSYARLDPSICGIVRIVMEPYACAREVPRNTNARCALHGWTLPPMHPAGWFRVAQTCVCDAKWLAQRQGSHILLLLSSVGGQGHAVRVCCATMQVVDSPFSRLTDLMTELVVEQVRFAVQQAPAFTATCCRGTLA